MAQAFLIYSAASSGHHANLAKTVVFYGIDCIPLIGSSLSEIVSQIAAQKTVEPICALVSGHALGELLANENDPTMMVEQFTRALDFLFVFGFRSGETSENALQVLSCNSLHSTSVGGTIEYAAGADHPQFTQELSGHSFKSPTSGEQPCFSLSGLSSVETLITANGKPFLCLLERSASKIFLTASSEIVDLDSPADNNFKFGMCFPGLIPLLLFLKAAFGDRMWHSPNHSLANLIIDDPLLRPKYGFVNFEELVRKADELDFTTTLAFIPWNHRRSSEATVRLFRDRTDRLSICVHGCDHISREFGAIDLGHLNSTIQTALSRVEDLQERTGLTVTKAMVFPQGHFSPASMLALKCNNFIAAINTELLPMTGTDEARLTVRDSLDVAIEKYHGFALFQRNYPEEAKEFPLQLFAGKPLFLVEHHGFFKNGFDRLTEVVDRVNAITPKVRWTNTSEILTQCYKLQKNGANEVRCHVFSSSQVLENRETMNQRFAVTKNEPDVDLVNRVLVDGESVEFEASDSSLRFEISVPALSSAQVNIEYLNPLPCPPRRLSAKQRTKIGMRRYLSEFRDNVIARNDILLSAAKLIKNKVAR